MVPQQTLHLRANEENTETHCLCSSVSSLTGLNGERIVVNAVCNIKTVN